MSYFWIKLQIPSIFLSQSKQPKKMLGYSVGSLNIISSIDPRYFWSWCRCKKGRSKSNVHCPRTECGKQLPERPKLCNPECSSKCLQLKLCDKKIVKQKLSNCDNPEMIKQKPYWEMFVISKTEVLPDPCTCRRIHREKQIAREQDPRLCDSRYEATPGDVFVFTEVPTMTTCKSYDPQPQPPPPYQLPNAVLTKNITEQAEKTPLPCAAALQFSASCINPKCSGQKPYNLPYNELRPPQRQRKAFSCKFGMRPEDVAPPIGKDSNNRLASKSANSSDPKYYREEPAKSFTDWKPLAAKSEDFSPQSSQKYSRVEQLKRQTEAKQCNNHSAILGSRYKKVSECRSPC